MDVYRTEEEQVEALRKWWAENAKSIIFGVLLGLGTIFGWRQWRDYHTHQAEEASQRYQEMIIALRDQNKSAKAVEVANSIIDDYGSTTYALFAKLALAKLAVDQDDYDSAATHLRWSLQNSEQESLTHLIRLRLARVLAAQEKYSEAIELLNQGETGQFGATYDELRGDILKLQGDSIAARSAYQEALVKQRDALQGDISVLEMKLNDLGGTESQ